jgi:diacylglycerol kinase
MLRRHTISLKNAINGLSYAVRTQPNYRIHGILSLLAVSLGFILKISYFEFLLIITLIFIGLTIETINTSIETATDAIDLKWREDIKIAKDLAAAAMLVFSVGAFTIASIIFLPKILFF